MLRIRKSISCKLCILLCFISRIDCELTWLKTILKLYYTRRGIEKTLKLIDNWLSLTTKLCFASWPVISVIIFLSFLMIPSQNPRHCRICGYVLGSYEDNRILCRSFNSPMRKALACGYRGICKLFWIRHGERNILVTLKITNSKIV